MFTNLSSFLNEHMNTEKQWITEKIDNTNYMFTISSTFQHDPCCFTVKSISKFNEHWAEESILNLFLYLKSETSAPPPRWQ